VAAALARDKDDRLRQLVGLTGGSLPNREFGGLFINESQVAFPEDIMTPAGI
jgi:hypothetical protein